ncbi:unnamed protein product [Linum trigynum]|uniref:Uncharacterized protein n=1 Tax=Linum trigynum TaxID=586398 RepID=A0AAV2DWW5_9ROSI
MCYDSVSHRMRIVYHVKFKEHDMYDHSSHSEANTTEALEFLTHWPSFESSPLSSLAENPAESSTSADHSSSLLLLLHRLLPPPPESRPPLHYDLRHLGHLLAHHLAPPHMDLLSMSRLLTREGLLLPFNR